VPPTVTVPANATSANFSVSTAAVGVTTIGNITASFSGVTKAVNITIQPAGLSSLTLNPSTVSGGSTVVGKVTLTGPAPTSGMAVTLTSSKSAQAQVPSKVIVPSGARSATFNITTTSVSRKNLVTIAASLGGVTKNASLTLQRR
jgi:hypothetical protein